MIGTRAGALLATLLLLSAGSAGMRAQGNDAKIDSLARNMNIVQKLDAQVDLELSFRDESGTSVRLGEYFGKERPVALMLVYYGCPMLCGQVMNGAVAALKQISLDVGTDYEIVTVSIDPREDHELASLKKRSFVRLFNRDGADAGWHFLTGDSASSAKLADQVGFRYYYDERIGQYAHSAAIMILTPDGKLSKYFYGTEYKPNDVQLGLVEASEGKIGSLAEQLTLLCYQYDPLTGSYGFAINRALKVVGFLTLALLGGFIILSLRKDRKKKAQSSEADAGVGVGV